MRILILFFFSILFFSCKNESSIKELKDKLDEYEILKEIILQNYYVIDSQLVSYNKYAEVKTLNNLQINSLTPLSLRDSIYSIKKGLGLEKIILVSDHGILFAIRKDEFIGKSETLYLVFSSDSITESVIYRNFSLIDIKRIDENWYLAKEITSMSH
jgi:hypothetical protein